MPELNYRYLTEQDSAILEQFQCDDEPTVRRFLVEQAWELQKLNLADTRLYFNESDELIGYFTLYNDMMQIGKHKRRKHGLASLPSYKYYPSVKLHYLGVDSRYRKQRYGEYLLLAALNTVKEISEQSGCVFLSVESLPSCVSFYERYEFHRLSYNAPYTDMFFKIGEL
ncbi:GNAT family N-acetyltransferase [Paenibacillus antibioticophila]|uniref:GNAT family N-acetyltransferase n=1 Tax=Paenibacillus antibioticophila TaxID=1274374 RepID=UPI0005CA1550|nr:GNAT family N-acetyltransferase [Paenibacillus antibioticophila]